MNNEILLCKSCNNYSLIKNEYYYFCYECKDLISIRNKKIINKSKPFINKNTHFNNVLKGLHNNKIDVDLYNEFKKIMVENNLNNNEITPTMISEFLKKKKIKNYKTTFSLSNKFNNKINFSAIDITKMSIIYSDFLSFFSENSENRSKTISCEYIFYEMLKILSNNNFDNSTYNSKRNDKDELWNSYLIKICNDNFSNNTFEYKPYNIINVKKLFYIPNMISIYDLKY
jgi:hypothetical protein